MANLTDIRSSWSAAASEGGLTVYATTDDLPTSGLTSGDQAYVSSSSRFYISNGTGWYNVALINATPSLTISPDGAIELATDGSTTTITLTATDSDYPDAALTFSVDSDGSFGGLATISQDSSVFTVTPLSQDSATTTSSTLTFKASDGISFGTGTTEFTLSFSVPNSKYTSLLLQADASSNDNQVDASTNTYTITEAGNTTSTAFTPYHPGGYSNYIASATNDYVEWSSPPTFSATAWCVETWFKPDGMPSVAVGTTGHWSIFGCWSANVNAKEFLVLGGSSGELRFYYSFDGSAAAFVDTASGLFSANTWVHLAVSFDGTNYTLYADGVNVARVANSSQIANTNSPLSFGKSIDGGGVTQTYVTGWYADGRVINGSTLESNDTFPVPTSRIDTSEANTQAVFHNKPHNRQSLTYAGSATIKRDGPYDYLGYSKSDHGGSVYFDGSGDYITGPSVTTGTTWTVETWVYPERHYSGSGHFDRIWAIGATTGDSLVLNMQNTGSVVYRVNDTIKITSSSNISLDVWTHVALVCDGSSTTLYFNGSSVGTVAETSSKTNYTFKISTLDNAQGFMKGYIADLRLVIGSAVYTSNFAAPTSPLTAITNTELLTCTNKNDVWDASTGKVLDKNSTAASNTERKFATSSAMYFDGTTGLEYEPGVDNPIYNFGTVDWTIEFWFRPNNGAATYTLLSMIKNNSGSLHNTPHIYTLSGSVYYYTDTNNRIIGGTLASNTWYHLAVTRSGNDHKMFLDGTQIGSTWTNAYTYAQGRVTLGNYYQSLNTLNPSNIFAGYMQNVRITKGLARYTGNFTPPTADFDG